MMILVVKINIYLDVNMKISIVRNRIFFSLKKKDFQYMLTKLFQIFTKQVLNLNLITDKS